MSTGRLVIVGSQEYEQTLWQKAEVIREARAQIRKLKRIIQKNEAELHAVAGRREACKACPLRHACERI